MCDICNNKSPGSKDVGVASVPSAPVSIMWCHNCLRQNAFPIFVVRTWLFSEFWQDDGKQHFGFFGMPENPPDKYPLAEWTKECTIWCGEERGYIKLEECLNEIWAEEYKRVQEEKWQLIKIRLEEDTPADVIEERS